MKDAFLKVGKLYLWGIIYSIIIELFILFVLYLLKLYSLIQLAKEIVRCHLDWVVVIDWFLYLLLFVLVI
jgi:hypothetical protein